MLWFFLLQYVYSNIFFFMTLIWKIDLGLTYGNQYMQKLISYDIV